METLIRNARNHIKRKCDEDENYVISKVEAYILICESTEEVVKLYVYEKLEEKIKSGKYAKEDLMNVCNSVFGKENPINSIVENMMVKDEFVKEELGEYKDIFDSFLKDNKKKM